MKSVRLGPELEATLNAAAAATGQPVSEIIREALRRHCRELLGDTLDVRLADVIGSVAGSRRPPQRTGRAFTELLAARDARRRSSRA